MEKMRCNAYSLLLGRLQLGTRGKFFTIRANRHWNNLSREVGDSPTLVIFDIQLDSVLAHSMILCSGSLLQL